ncbi:translation initiation factor IF-3 [Prorops nasuta]|uniref:translation initiation factor IF-3 n=1 Tax=Prorops nasuta TaxID=863751 RepID=UPI0034CE9267
MSTLIYNGMYIRNTLVRLFNANKYLVTFKHVSSSNNLDDSTTDSPNQKKPKPKTIRIPQITLYLLDNSITTTTLENAMKIAKRRSLKLVKECEFDKVKETPIYRLVSSSQYLEDTYEIDDNEDENKKQSSKERKQKIFIISGTSADHDIQIKIKQMEKLLKQKYSVKVTIQGDTEKAVNTGKKIKQGLQEYGDIKEKLAKKNNLNLSISPKLLESNQA